MAEGSSFLSSATGHAGLIYSAQLVKAGFSAQEIVFIDSAGGVGGTWVLEPLPGTLAATSRGNATFPCSRRQATSGHIPTHRYSRGEEIRNFGLRGMFCTKFIGARGDEEQWCWTAALQRQLGAKHEEPDGPFTVCAQFLISAPGPVHNLSAPTLPGFSGLHEGEGCLAHGAVEL